MNVSASAQRNAKPRGGVALAQSGARSLEDQLTDDIAYFFDDPEGFVLFAYPWGEPGPLQDEAGPDEWQLDVLRSIGEEVKRGKSIGEAIRGAVASGHGIGKTTLIAWIVQWFMSTREMPQIVVTASTQTQLNTKTWRELAKWHRLLINRHWFNWTATRYHHVDYADTWFAAAIPWSKANADAFAGTHEKYVLIIYDEGQAIDNMIWDTTEGALTTPGAIWLVFGNYTKNTGKFHDCFAGRARERIQIRRQIDSRTCRKANQKQIAQWVADYGEDSDFVRIRVRGVAPRTGADQFVSQEIVDSCVRYKAVGFENLAKILILDVARFGDNQSVASIRQGRKFRVLKKWRELPIDQLADKFGEYIESEKPDAIVIDGDGIGGSVVDLIRRKRYDTKDGKDILFEFHGGAKPTDPKMYFNRRAEVAGLARDAMKNGIELPEDDKELLAEAVSFEYTYVDRAGFAVIQIESKDDMRARGVASPDTWDTLAMSYAVDVRPAKKKPPERQRYAQAGDSGANSWMET